MKVERNEYLDKLIAFREKKLIKIVTGIRRCGKSTLLEMYQEYLLKQGVVQEQIISINFEDFDYEELTDATKLHTYIKERLVDGRSKTPVELRLCPRSLEIIEGTPAGERDFDTEFLDYILAVKVVDSVKEAVDHIEKHSTHHSEAIITSDMKAADLFTRCVDSSSVYVNASTRFTDGGEFGLGCEMGISTQKLHARGPMGLRELTTYKYIVRGNGNIR